MLEVVFAVGGDTDSAEWLDTEAGEKPVCLDPLVENSCQTLTDSLNYFLSQESGFSLPACHLLCGRQEGVWFLALQLLEHHLILFNL